MSGITTSSGARIAIGGILHETHTFMEAGTTLADFAAQSLHFGDDLLSSMRDSRTGIGGMIEGAIEYNWQLLPTLYAAAMPAGTVTEGAYRKLLSELTNRLAQHMPLDGVLLTLHGAMVAEDELDAEADIVAQVRAIVGGAVPIVVLLGYARQYQPAPCRTGGCVAGLRYTNPHTDAYARGLDAAEIMARLLRRELQPTAAYARPALLLPAQSTATEAAPLKLVHARAAEIKADDDVISIAVMAGFAYADTPFTGPSIIVTTDNQPELAAAYADELSAILFEQRHKALPRFLSPTEAVLQAKRQERGPVILVDSADNIGGGTTGDGADALAAMLAHEVREGAIVLADPEAVAICWRCRKCGTSHTRGRWQSRPLAWAADNRDRNCARLIGRGIRV